MYKNIHNLIKNEYDKRQKISFDDLMRKRDEVYTKIPRIEEIDNEVRLAGVKYNKMILLGTASSGNAVNGLLAAVNNLKHEKEILLQKYSYSCNYLEPEFQCAQCNDTGFVENAGRTEKCNCYKQQYINYLFNQSNLNSALVENFSNFNEHYYPDIVDEARYGIKISPREYILKIKDRVLNFIENFSKPDEKNLFFSGPTGLGKTFMVNCIAAELLQRGILVLYQTAPSLFETINVHRLKNLKDDGYEETCYNDIFSVDLLIIDDLGTESYSSARHAELLNILNTRVQNNMSRPCKTIISTNVGVNNLHEYYGERVASRITGDFDLFRFVGEDIRMLKKNALRPG